MPAAAPAQLDHSARQQAQRQSIEATFGPQVLQRRGGTALVTPINVDAVPAIFRPIVRAMLQAVQEGLLVLSQAQRTALLLLLASLADELANPPAAAAAPALDPPVMLSTAIGLLLGMDAAPFMGGVDVQLPPDFFARHPLDITGLQEDGGAPPGQARGPGQAPELPALEHGAGLPDLASLMAALRRGEAPAFDFSRLRVWLEDPAPVRRAPLALPAPQRDENPQQIVLGQPPAVRQLMQHLMQFPHIRAETAWLYFQLGFDRPATLALVPQLAVHPGQAMAQALVWAYQAPGSSLPATLAMVPTLAAHPGMNQPQVHKALQVYVASGGQVPNVLAWIQRGMKLAHVVVPPPGRVLAGHVAVGGGVYPPLHPLGVDAGVWQTYHQERTALDAGKQAALANAAANNQKTWQLIQPDVTTALQTFATHAANRDALVKTDLDANRDALVSLGHVADHYSTVPKRARLASLDQFNTAKHNASIGVLWNNWSAVRTAAAGKAKFDYLYNAIGTVKWNANPGVIGQPDATRNPLILKSTLPAMDRAVLDGLVNNLGTLRNKFNRGPHNTNPTGQGGGGGTEYNAVAHIAPGGPKWATQAKQVNPPGARRFIAHPSGKWFYVPQHYIGPKGWAGPAAYRLVIDAV